MANEVKGQNELQQGHCIVCNATMAAHFAQDGRWTGCKVTQRRGTVFVPPVVLIVTPEMLAQLQHAPAAKPERHVAQEVTPRATRRQRRSAENVQPAAEQETRGRGRIPGVYKSGAKTPTVLTDSISRVYQFVTKHKRGAQMKDMSAKLDMPSGTVGWALRKLIQQGAVEYHPAAA